VHEGRERRLGNEQSELTIPAGEVELAGTLSMPDRALGLVVFAHGSGSSRFSPRNRSVARVLEGHGLATLLFDLLTADEERADAIDAHLRFDIPLLARRLVAVTDWASRDARTQGLPIGYFGASTGAAAALIAAAERPRLVAAVVSRGGRPDLAGGALPHVLAPTLLIVGGADVPVIGMNRDAASQMSAPCKLSIVPGATHLFEERGALEEVARQASDFLVQHLVALPRERAKPRGAPEARR
jgi:dienelactone hydrolase